MGYHQALEEAGIPHTITGIDIKPMPRYPFEFIQADALEYCAAHGSEYDFIHASPPCQGYSELKYIYPTKSYPLLLHQARGNLRMTLKPYVIENVEGAKKHLSNPIVLCGTMFGLGVDGADLYRHRCFELNFSTIAPQCRHNANNVIGIYGGHGRNRKVITVVGHIGGSSNRDSKNGFNKDQRNRAMGIDWMTQAELSQAIPPAYTRFIMQRYLEASR